MFRRLVQPSKADSPIEVILSDKTTSVKAVQRLNESASIPCSVQLFETLNDFKDEQSEKIPMNTDSLSFSLFRLLLFISTDRIPLFINAPSPIGLMASRTTSTFKLLHPAKAWTPIYLTFLGKLVTLRFLHPLKAHASITRRVSCRSKLVKLEQPARAREPMLVRLLCSLILLNLSSG